MNSRDIRNRFTEPSVAIIGDAMIVMIARPNAPRLKSLEAKRDRSSHPPSLCS
jgi:hypothetical protein